MKRFVSGVMVASLIAAPAAASVREAAFAPSADPTRAETSIFVGINYRVGLNGTRDADKGRASLKVAGMVKTSDARFRFGEGLGLAAGPKGKPALFIGGQEVRVKRDKANLSTAGTIGLAVVGVLVVGAGVAYLALRDPCDGRDCE